MVDMGSQILVKVGPFCKSIPTVMVAGHHGHVLEVAFPAFITHRAVMGMVGHEKFNNRSPELKGFRVIDGDAHVIADRRHAGHDDFAGNIFFIPKPLHSALAACANRPDGRVPAEIRDIKSQGQAGMKEILAFFDLIRPAFDDNGCHVLYFHGHFFSLMCR
jgi:hypothetical protein